MAREMSLEEVEAIAARHGKTLMPRAEWEELCSLAAAGIAAKAEIDRDYEALMRAVGGGQ